MPATYTHTTRSTGTILTANIYNTDHQNHIDNGDAAHLGGYSTSVAQMQSTTSPGGVGTESLATTLADEIQRIRYKINEIIGGAQWYSTVPVSLTSANSTFADLPTIILGVDSFL